MGQRKYFHTWSSQNNPKTIELKATFNWGYLTQDEREVYDLSSGSYHQSFGLQNQRLKKALEDQLAEIPMAIPKTEFHLKKKVSEDFIDRIGIDGRIFYTLSGAESNENAIKIVRQVTGKEIILSCENSYHGATFASLSISGDWRRTGLGLTMNGHAFIPNFYDDPDLAKTKKIIEELGASNIAAICLETITGGNGIYIPSNDYYTKLEKLCRNNNIKIILDEVVCGFGRTGKDFGFQNYTLTPDIITFAKSISGGFFPFGATFVSEEISKYFDDHTLSCGLTNAAHPLGLKALEEVLKITSENEFKTKLEQNSKLLKKFKGIYSNIDSVIEVRHIGMLMAIELNESKDPRFKDMRSLWDECLSKGIYINTTRNMIILCPYLNFPTELLENCLNKLKEILENK